MRRFIGVILIIACFLAICSWLLYGQEQPEKPEKNSNLIQECIKNISKIQTLLEYYYIKIGEYPYSLDELDKNLNDLVPEGSKKIILPNDPATKKPFDYKRLDPQIDRYILKCSDPALYGLKNIELHPVDWGWMNKFVFEERYKYFLQACIQNMKRLATGIEIYAANYKEYPNSLKKFYEVYSEEPYRCPLTGSEYIYTKLESGFEVICPNPGKHNMRILKYNSSEGIIWKK